MKDFKISNTELLFSQKRQEFLLEELIYQTIKLRCNKEETTAEFGQILRNVSNQIELYIKDIQDSQ